jgi:hypothetical protein
MLNGKIILEYILWFRDVIRNQGRFKWGLIANTVIKRLGSVNSEFFFVVKGPAADATDAPQP